MTAYGIYTENGTIVRARDGACIPIDPLNRDYQEAMGALANGQEISSFQPALPTLNDFKSAIQSHIDAVARTKQYDGGASCASYVASTNSLWAAESAAFIAWRDTVWNYALTELARVQTGQRSQPSSTDSFVSEFPVINWPDSPE